MTIASCFACGEWKVESFAPYPAYGAEHQANEALAHSLALTDRYLTPEGLAHVQQQAMAGSALTSTPTATAAVARPTARVEVVVREA